MTRVRRYLHCLCRVVEQTAPELLEWAGVNEWLQKNRNADAQFEGEIIVQRTHKENWNDFEEKCKVLRKLTQQERETLGYGRFPLRFEDYEGLDGVDR